jgi:hypothetical protein
MSIVQLRQLCGEAVARELWKAVVRFQGDAASAVQAVMSSIGRSPSLHRLYALCASNGFPEDLVTKGLVAPIAAAILKVPFWRQLTGFTSAEAATKAQNEVSRALRDEKDRVRISWADCVKPSTPFRSLTSLQLVHSNSELHLGTNVGRLLIARLAHHSNAPFSIVNDCVRLVAEIIAFSATRAAVPSPSSSTSGTVFLPLDIAGLSSVSATTLELLFPPGAVFLIKEPFFLCGTGDTGLDGCWVLRVEQLADLILLEAPAITPSSAALANELERELGLRFCSSMQARMRIGVDLGLFPVSERALGAAHLERLSKLLSNCSLCELKQQAPLRSFFYALLAALIDPQSLKPWYRVLCSALAFPVAEFGHLKEDLAFWIAVSRLRLEAVCVVAAEDTTSASAAQTIAEDANSRLTAGCKLLRDVDNLVAGHWTQIPASVVAESEGKPKKSPRVPGWALVNLSIKELHALGIIIMEVDAIMESSTPPPTKASLSVNLALVEMLHGQGNKSFSAGQWATALSNYRDCIKALTDGFPLRSNNLGSSYSFGSLRHVALEALVKGWRVLTSRATSREAENGTLMNSAPAFALPWFKPGVVFSVRHCNPRVGRGLFVDCERRPSDHCEESAGVGKVVPLVKAGEVIFRTEMHASFEAPGHGTHTGTDSPLSPLLSHDISTHVEEQERLISRLQVEAFVDHWAAMIVRTLLPVGRDALWSVKELHPTVLAEQCSNPFDRDRGHAASDVRFLDHDLRESLEFPRNVGIFDRMRRGGVVAVPSPSLPAPVDAWLDLLSIGVPALRGIYYSNAFDFEADATPLDGTEGEAPKGSRIRCGLWVVGALMNHSFSPNVRYRLCPTDSSTEMEKDSSPKGSVWAVEGIAARDIYGGEELLDCYFSLPAPRSSGSESEVASASSAVLGFADWKGYGLR